MDPSPESRKTSHEIASQDDTDKIDFLNSEMNKTKSNQQQPSFTDLVKQTIQEQVPLKKSATMNISKRERREHERRVSKRLSSNLENPPTMEQEPPKTIQIKIKKFDKSPTGNQRKNGSPLKPQHTMRSQFSSSRQKTMDWDRISVGMESEFMSHGVVPKRQSGNLADQMPSLRQSKANEGPDRKSKPRQSKHYLQAGPKKSSNGRMLKESPKHKDSREDYPERRQSAALNAGTKQASQRKTGIIDIEKADIEESQPPTKRKYSLLRKNTFDKRSMLGKFRRQHFANRAEKNAYNDLEVVSFYDWDQKSEFKGRPYQPHEQPNIQIDDFDDSRRHYLSSSFSSSLIEDSEATPKQSQRGEPMQPSLFKEAKLGQINKIKTGMGHLAQSSLAPARAGGQLKAIDDSFDIQRSNTRVSAQEKMAKRNKLRESKKSSTKNAQESPKLELIKLASLQSDNAPGLTKSNMGSKAIAGLSNLRSSVLGKQDPRQQRDDEESRSLTVTDRAGVNPKIFINLARDQSRDGPLESFISLQAQKSLNSPEVKIKRSRTNLSSNLGIGNQTSSDIRRQLSVQEGANKPMSKEINAFDRQHTISRPYARMSIRGGEYDSMTQLNNVPYGIEIDSSNANEDTQRQLLDDSRSQAGLPQRSQFPEVKIDSKIPTNLDILNRSQTQSQIEAPKIMNQLELPVDRMKTVDFHLSDSQNIKQAQKEAQQSPADPDGSLKTTLPRKLGDQRLFKLPPDKKLVSNSSNKFSSSSYSTMINKLKNKHKVYKQLLFLPEDSIVTVWNVFASINLVVACFMTPYGLAFDMEDESMMDQIFVFASTWTTIESIVDMIFILEILICFNTSFYDADTNEYVDSRRTIACSYARGWFVIDVCAILPRFLRVLESQKFQQFSTVLSFFKIARITRLIKLFRLIKMAKTMKEKEKLQKQMQAKLRLNVAMERLAIFWIFAVLFIHTIACIWIYLAVLIQEQETFSDNWIDNFQFSAEDDLSMYVIAFYWTVTTITTVGYGDISATNTAERIVAAIIMIFGVIAFSLTTGSLSSIIQTQDSRQALYRQKLDILKQLRSEYGIDNKLYMELNAFINFQSQQRHEERDQFIKGLPERLRFQMSQLLYAEYKKHIKFFQKVEENANFIAWLCPNLTPLEVIEGALIQVEQEKLTHISFIKQGEAAYVIQRYNNDPYKNCLRGEFFGVMDVVFRIKQDQRRKEIKRERREMRRNESSDRSESSSSSTASEDEHFSVLNQKIKCKFTIQAKQTCILLQMEKQALDKMRLEFPDVFVEMVTPAFEECRDIIFKKYMLIRKLEARYRRRSQVPGLADGGVYYGDSGDGEFEEEESASDSSENSQSRESTNQRRIQIQNLDNNGSVSPRDESVAEATADDNSERRESFFSFNSSVVRPRVNTEHRPSQSTMNDGVSLRGLRQISEEDNEVASNNTHTENTPSQDCQSQSLKHSESQSPENNKRPEAVQKLPSFPEPEIKRIPTNTSRSSSAKRQATRVQESDYLSPMHTIAKQNMEWCDIQHAHSDTVKTDSQEDDHQSRASSQSHATIKVPPGIECSNPIHVPVRKNNSLVSLGSNLRQSMQSQSSQKEIPPVPAAASRLKSESQQLSSHNSLSHSSSRLKTANELVVAPVSPMKRRMSAQQKAIVASENMDEDEKMVMQGFDHDEQRRQTVKKQVKKLVANKHLGNRRPSRIRAQSKINLAQGATAGAADTFQRLMTQTDKKRDSQVLGSEMDRLLLAPLLLDQMTEIGSMTPVNGVRTSNTATPSQKHTGCKPGMANQNLRDSFAAYAGYTDSSPSPQKSAKNNGSGTKTDKSQLTQLIEMSNLFYSLLNDKLTKLHDEVGQFTKLANSEPHLQQKSGQPKKIGESATQFSLNPPKNPRVKPSRASTVDSNELMSPWKLKRELLPAEFRSQSNLDEESKKATSVVASSHQSSCSIEISRININERPRKYSKFKGTDRHSPCGSMADSSDFTPTNTKQQQATSPQIISPTNLSTTNP